MTPQEEKIISDAEDAAYGADAPSDSAEAAQGDMPAGFDQLDSDYTPEQMRAIRRNMYFFHGFVGILLLPIALILRTGRWTMRTLSAHHNGWEFGSW